MNEFINESGSAPIDRSDGKQKVTGAAKYSAEYDIPGMVYGVLVGSTIAHGEITTIETKSAERAPGVLSVITYKNSIKVPGYDEGVNPAKGRVNGKGLKVFNDNLIHFSGQPIALVIADSFERALYAASLVSAKYQSREFVTDQLKAFKSAQKPARSQNYLRGNEDAFKSAQIKVDNEYIQAREVHNPMELHAIIAVWEGSDKVTVYDKTQGVRSTRQSIAEAFKLKTDDVKVMAPFVGGAFGSALRTWPHEIAALIGAKQTGKPLKLVLSRDQMFQLVGFRPYTWQRLALGANKDGKLTSIIHEATGETSSYEEFTEGTTGVSKFLYECPNVITRYKVAGLNISTPTWMRGPGEATGTFALESAMDELAEKLGIDPLELRLVNYAEKDPETKLPFSSKYLKEAYLTGAEKIGWKNRQAKAGSVKQNGWFSGYGMSTGLFGAYRGKASTQMILRSDGSLLIRCSVTDIGPGTGTFMTKIASDLLGIDPALIICEIGNSDLPDAPTQGGSAITSTVGSAIHDTCISLQKKLLALAKQNYKEITDTNEGQVLYKNGSIELKDQQQKRISYTDILKANHLQTVEAMETSQGNDEMKKYSFYSFSVHFVHVLVHPETGRIKINKIVTGADSGTIISEKTARSQMIGGVVGGIGMALTEETVTDNRYGRIINNNFADYHVPVNADVPFIETFFINKPDSYINPIGAKGMGEIALIGFSAAVANAVYNATGKRIRELPITPDKVLFNTV